MIHTGDCVEVMAAMEPESIDAIVTDPPYGLEFMGKEWDRLGGGDARSSKPGIGDRPTPWVSNLGWNGVRCTNCGHLPHGGSPCSCDAPDWRTDDRMPRMQAWHQQWATAAYRVAKPSAYLLAFGGTRTVHRLTCALEDAGWIIRDLLVWGYASGFPKSKASLKPAWEPIVMARKPGPLRELAIDACRIPTNETWEGGPTQDKGGVTWGGPMNEQRSDSHPAGRWPANIVLTDEIFEPGVEGVVIAGSLTGTMTAWSRYPDNEPNPTASLVSSAAPRSSRTGRAGNSRGTATDPAGTQLDAWETSTDTPKPDTGCSDGTTADGRSTSGSTATSGSRPTDPSLTGTSSTTRTATGSTTDSTISSSSLGESTQPITSLSERGSGGRSASETLSDDSVNWRRSSPTAASRAGEPSADRRYDGPFAALPGERRDVDGYGYSRFFLIPKADRADREPVLGGLPVSVVNITEGHGLGPVNTSKGGDGIRENRPRANVHPTVKPTDLMRHLVRLVTPSGGTVLDPFLGSGTTGIACELEGFPWVGIEREEEYVRIAEARLNGTQKGLGI